MSEMLLAARPRARVRPLFLARRWYGALSRPIANHEGIHPWGIDLIFLNALGLVLCVVLIAAAATNNDPVCAENLDSDVLVMQPANQGIRHNASDPLNWARDRCILGQ